MRTMMGGLNLRTLIGESTPGPLMGGPSVKTARGEATMTASTGKWNLKASPDLDGWTGRLPLRHQGQTHAPARA